MSNQGERRRFRRFPLEASGLLHLAGGLEMDCELLDLSINGALVEQARPRDETQAGDSELRLRPRGSHSGEALDLRVMVKALRLEARRLACRFTAVDGGNFAALKQLVIDNLGDPLLLDRELTQLDYWPGLAISPAP